MKRNIGDIRHVMQALDGNWLILRLPDSQIIRDNSNRSEDNVSRTFNFLRKRPVPLGHSHSFNCLASKCNDQIFSLYG